MTTDIEVRLLGPLEVAVEGRAAWNSKAPSDGGDSSRWRSGHLNPCPWTRWSRRSGATQPPEGRDQALQKQVSRLRARLGEALPVRRRAAGYALEIERTAIDTHRFEALMEPAAGEFVQVALALWRGPALADHRFDNFAQAEVARARELRLEATEERLAAELEHGQAGDLVGELRALVAEHPLRERLRGRLMLAATA